MPVEYPQREPYFAHRFIRLLFKVCAAYQIGADGVALLTCIAMTEDAARYRRPVSYFNNQLMHLLGFTKWDRLKRVRDLCVQEGWLVYTQKGTRKAGTYFVTIPPHAEGLPDGSLDEGTPHEPYPESGDNAGDNAGIMTGIIRGQSGGQSGDNEGDPPILCPSPNPSPSPNGSCVEPEGSPPQPEEPESPVVLEYPTSRTGQTWPLQERHIEIFVECYPGIDVMAHCRAALAWCHANPKQRKTAGGMLRFLNGWLGKEQNRSRGATNGPAMTDKERADEGQRIYEQRKAQTDAG